MAIARGLTRLWVVLTVVHMLVVAVVSVQIYYQQNEDLGRIEADIEKKKKDPNAEPDYHYYGTPEQRLEQIARQREQMKWAVPLIAVAPPVAIYCLAAALVWALAGFKSEPKKSEFDER